MGLFGKKEKAPEAPLSNIPDMDACNQLFAEMCDVMYKNRRTLLELEIVLGMLQNEIIMNKTHNALMSQVGRLPFIPPVFPMMPETEPVVEPIVESKSGNGSHYQ